MSEIKYPQNKIPPQNTVFQYAQNQAFKVIYMHPTHCCCVFVSTKWYIYSDALLICSSVSFLQSNEAVGSSAQQKFESWYSRWQEDNVLPEGATLCDQWLLGQYEESGQQSEKLTESYAGRNRNYYQQIKKT